jgi:hypothetical protein
MPADIWAVACWAAEAKIGDLFRNRSFTDKVALERKAVNPVARARPNVAVDVDAETVRNAGRDFGDNAAFAERDVRDLERPDVMRPIRVWPEASVRDVEKFLVGRQGKSIRAPEVVYDNGSEPSWVEAIDIATAISLSALPPS